MLFYIGLREKGYLKERKHSFNECRSTELI